MIATRRWMLGTLAPAVLAALSPLPGRSAQAGDRIAAHWRTGLAIHGFDPVAYFADGRATPGRGEFEYAFGGAIWRFRNDGNRAAFAAHPEVYLPRFGGYDPVALTRGVAVAGNPLFWLLAADQLYLFHGPQTRQAFAANPGAVIAASEQQWPNVLEALVP